jgi:DNA replication protein DnaC
MSTPLLDLPSATVATHEALDAAIPARYRDARTHHPEILSWVAQYSENAAETPSLLILGRTGVGKTHNAYGALRLAVVGALRPNRVGQYTARRWRAITFSDYLAAMRPSRHGDPETALAELRETPLLMIDDLGIAKGSEFVEECTYRLISGRYDSQKPTIYTTNLALGELKEALGDRIASRLAETCARVVLDGPDRRRIRLEEAK